MNQDDFCLFPSRKDLVNALVSDYSDDYCKVKTLDHRLIGNNLWAIVSAKDTETRELSHGVVLHVLNQYETDEGYRWAHRTINDHEGAFAEDCPLDLFVQLKPPAQQLH